MVQSLRANQRVDVPFFLRIFFLQMHLYLPHHFFMREIFRMNFYLLHKQKCWFFPIKPQVSQMSLNGSNNVVIERQLSIPPKTPCHLKHQKRDLQLLGKDSPRDWHIVQAEVQVLQCVPSLMMMHIGEIDRSFSE